MEKKTTFLGQLQGFYQNLSGTKRLLLTLLTAGTLVAVLYATTIGSRVDYALLYSDLSTEDAAAITQKLEQLKVPHRLAANGSAIEVSKQDVPNIRLQLASEGLPRGGGAGFELFDQQRFGATEFEQNVNLRRALEGELSRSIATIEGVQSARVHLVLPERRLFASDEEKSSASVVLKLRNPAAFGKREVAATVHLVSSAIPGLSPTRVSVISTDGTTLQRPSTDDSLIGGLGDTRTEQERAVAHQLETHVQSLIERVVGPGNAEVRANLRLSSATTERTAESYEPAKTALRSEQRSEEFSGGDGPSVAGVPGATTNLAGGEVEVTPGADAKLFRRSLTKNWEVDRVTEKTIIPAGSITKLTLSVLVNERLVGAPGEQTREPWDEVELERLAEVAKNAVGFDEARGDSFSIQSVAFVEPVKLPEPAPPSEVEPQLPIPWIAAAAGGALLLVILLIALVRGKKSAARAASVDVLRRLEEASQLAGPAQTPQLAGASSLEVEELHERALELARRDPATAAFIIRSWIRSDNAEAPERAPSTT